MQWINLPRNKRISDWHSTLPPKPTSIQAASKWCREHSSNGGFYYNYTNSAWWFEHKDDALLFTLAWGSPVQQRKRNVQLEWEWHKEE